MHHADLSFTVRIARSPRDIEEACRVRALAYGRHVPEFYETLRHPDSTDQKAGSAILLCRDKASGEAIGTARVLRNLQGGLQLESSVILPHHLADQPRAEITRLAVLPGADPLVRLALMKASYLYCLATQSRWMVIGARNDALIRIYRRLGFCDVLDDGDRVPLSHAGGLLHNILAFDVIAAERTWRASAHGLYPFMIETYHRDLQLFEECPAAAAEPVRAERAGGSDQRQAA